MSNSDFPTMDLSYHSAPYANSMHELMRAIILRTVDDYHSKSQFFEEANEYLWDEDEEYIFSFKSICNQLGMDAPKTRDAIINCEHKISTRRRAA